MNLFDVIRYIDTRIIHKIGVQRSRRIARFVIGAIPTFGVLWFVGILTHNLLMDEPVYLVGYVVKYSFAIFFLLTVLSIAYEFCWVHRSFVLYCYLVSLCIEYQIRTGFGEWLLAARITSLVIGLLLLVFFIQNNCWREFVEKQKKVK